MMQSQKCKTPLMSCKLSRFGRCATQKPNCISDQCTTKNRLTSLTSWPSTRALSTLVTLCTPPSISALCTTSWPEFIASACASERHMSTVKLLLCSQKLRNLTTTSIWSTNWPIAWPRGDLVITLMRWLILTSCSKSWLRPRLLSTQKTQLTNHHRNSGKSIKNSWLTY